MLLLLVPLFVSMLFISACSGGGGGGNPPSVTPPPANLTPPDTPPPGNSTPPPVARSGSYAVQQLTVIPAVNRLFLSWTNPVPDNSAEFDIRAINIAWYEETTNNGNLFVGNVELRDETATPLGQDYTELGAVRTYAIIDLKNRTSYLARVSVITDDGTAHPSSMLTRVTGENADNDEETGSH